MGSGNAVVLHVVCNIFAMACCATLTARSARLAAHARIP